MVKNVRNQVGVSTQPDDRSSGKYSGKGKLEDDMDFGAIDDGDEFD